MDYKYYYSEIGFDQKWVNIINAKGKTVAHARLEREDGETEWHSGGYDLYELIELAKTYHIVNVKFLKLRGIPLWTSKASL